MRLSLVVYSILLINTSLSAKIRHQSADNFIEDIIKVDIPDVIGAYNASIVDYEDGYLMAFRYDIFKSPIALNIDEFYQYIGIIRLNENFKPIGPWHPCIGSRTYDPRLLKVDDTIYMIFASAAPSDSHSCLSSRLNLCTINYSEEEISISNFNALRAPFQNTWEKNWVLFSYNSKILMEYEISPHVILEPSLQDGSCEMLEFNSDTDEQVKIIEWPYGIIRGGTPALLVDDKYLGFFHSSRMDKITKKYTYYIGAYTFSNTPPFTIDRVSISPFFHPDFYSTPKNAKTTSRVVFPGGFVIKNDKIYLCYGENDDAIKIMVLDKCKLFASMKTVE